MSTSDSEGVYEADEFARSPSGAVEVTSPVAHTSRDHRLDDFSLPDATALAMSLERMKLLTAKVEDSADLSEKMLVLGIQELLFDLGNSRALLDAVALVARRQRLAWTTKTPALAALVRITCPNIPNRREYAFADVLRLTKGMSVEEAELRITNAGGVDKIARKRASERNKLRARWERDLPHIAAWNDTRRP